MAGMLVDEPQSLWRPLNTSQKEIRLLHLRLDIDGDPTGSLSVISLEDHDHTDYIAISHAWQRAEVVCPFVLDGTMTFLPRNIWNCFLYFLQKQSAVVVWVDAVCISQQDLHEKSQQVKEMHAVFSQAQEVRVWHGADLLAIEHLFHSIETDEDFIAGFDEAQLQTFVLRLCLLNKVSWWGRLWVRQEVALAKDVLLCYRQTMIPLTKLERWCKEMLRPRITAIEALTDGAMIFAQFTNRMVSFPGLEKLNQRASNWVDREKSLQLVQMLSDARQSAVTDIRDR